MEDGRITNDQLSASSTQTGGGYSARYGRLNNNFSWKPVQSFVEPGASSAAGEWIQVALPSPIMATAIATQGKHPNDGLGPLFDEYVTRYKVQISSDGQSWRYIQNTEDNGDRVIIEIVDPVHVITSFD